MKRNQQGISEKRKRKMSAKYLEGGYESNYARKRAYLNKHGLWGWEVPAPKPWKRAE